MKVIAVSALLLLGQLAVSQQKVNASTGPEKSIEKLNEAHTMKLEELIEKAANYFHDGAYAQAVSVYNIVAKRSAVNSDMHYGAMSGIAEIHARTGDYAAERDQYLRMQGLYKEGDVQRQLCRKLADVELRLTNYTMALTLVNQHNSIVRKGSYCGNSRAEDEQTLACLSFRAYLGLKDTLSAIGAILPQMFYNGAVVNDGLVDWVLPVFLARYDRAFWKKELDNAAANIIGVKKAKRPTEYQTTILGVQVQVPPFYQSMKASVYIASPGPEKENREFAITKSYFYLKACFGNQQY
ncbi:MAG: hypothetical protein ACTHMC_17270 [Pseudobacter sp.]|uniref:hypothetical protein n=1 Tax=Pseudobacter sp. TaxID=2045420 RepID=UPI003F81F8DC